MTLGRAIDAYLATLRDAEQANTRRAYGQVLRRLAAEFARRPRPAPSLLSGSSANRVREELLAHLKREQVEPPARDRIRRIMGAALRQAEQALTTRIASRVPAEAVGRIHALIARAADPGEERTSAPAATAGRSTPRR